MQKGKCFTKGKSRAAVGREPAVTTQFRKELIYDRDIIYLNTFLQLHYPLDVPPTRAVSVVRDYEEGIPAEDERRSGA